jgi:hypothetical protein
MPSAGSLDLVRLKIGWAKKHFNELVSVMDWYFKANPCQVVSELDPATNEISSTRVIVNNPIPPEVPLLIGDCLQNLRTALDYLVWELVLAAKGTPNKKNEFPICTSKDLFEESLKRGRLDGVPVLAKTAIERLQPYNTGNDPMKARLWVLNHLTNINKHRRLLLTTIGVRFSLDPRLSTVSYGEPIIDALACGNADTPVTVNAEQVAMDAFSVAGIAFNEGALKGSVVASVLEGLID